MQAKKIKSNCILLQRFCKDLKLIRPSVLLKRVKSFLILLKLKIERLCGALSAGTLKQRLEIILLDELPFVRANLSLHLVDIVCDLLLT